MQENNNQEGFEIPHSFLLQLEEYTRGYLLLVCNEQGDLYAHESYDNAVIRLGLTNFANMHVTAALQHMQNTALRDEEENHRIIEHVDEDLDDDSDDDKF
jgi:hypothetical protein